MNNKAFIKKRRVSWRNIGFAITIMIMVLITINAAAATLESGTVSYYKEDGNWSDATGVNDGTNSGSIYTSSGMINGAYSFDGTNDYVSTTLQITSVPVSLSVWIKTSASVFQIIYATGYAASGYNIGIRLYIDATGHIGFSGSGADDIRTTTAYNDGNWYHVVGTMDSSSLSKLYVDGSYYGSLSDNTPTDTNYLYIGAYPTGYGSTNRFNGVIDEVAIFDYALSTSDVSYLYNSGIPGSAQQYPYTSASASNFTITVTDYWDNSTINNAWAYIGSTNYTTANGTIITNILDNSTSLHNIIIGGSDHFNRDYDNVNVSTNLEADLYGSDVMFRAYEAVTGDEISANFTVGTTTKTQNESFYLTPGITYTVFVTSNSYYGVNQSFNVSGVDNKTVDVAGLYDAEFVVIPRDILNNNTINGSNITLSNSTFGYNVTVSGVFNATFYVVDGNYLLEIVAPNRSYYSENVTVTNGSITHYAYLYAFNSIWVYAFRQSDSVAIQNFNVTVNNATVQYNATGALGVVRLSLIPSGVYTVIVGATGYTSASYSLTMTDNSVQILNAYLSAATDTFIFTVKDKSTNGLLEGATLTQKRFVGGVLTVVASKVTDITGRTQFTYENGVEYTFIGSKVGYDSKTFTLTILFPSYNLLLVPLVTTNETAYFDDVVLSVTNYSLNNVSSWFNVDFYSPRGSLEYYSVNMSFPDGSSSYLLDNQPIGSDVNVSLNTTTRQYGDVVTLTILYKSTLNSGDKVVSRTYMFSNWVVGEGSFSYLVTELEGESDLTKVFWGFVMVASIAALFGVIGLFAGDVLLFSSVGGIIGVVMAGTLGLYNWVVAGTVIFILAIFVVGGVVKNG